MNYSVRRVGAHAHIDVPVELQPFGDGLLVLLCAGGSTSNVPPGFAALWWAIRGQSVALTSDSRAILGRKTIFISDSQRAHSLSVQPSGAAIALIGSQAFWTSVVSLLDKDNSNEPAVFPALHVSSFAVRKQLLRFLRLVLANEADTLETSKAVHLGNVICELQRPFGSLISRCPGRNASRQRMVFLRLQRVRNYLSHCTQQNADVRKLALTTNYSVWRFIRVYFSVFGETPYSYISRCRMDRARKLLETGEHCVSDVALAVGFENGSSLTRAIKKRYGLSSTQIRRASDKFRAHAEESML